MKLSAMSSKALANLTLALDPRRRLLQRESPSLRRLPLATRWLPTIILALFLLASCAAPPPPEPPAPAQVLDAPVTMLEAYLDSVYPPGEPGAAVLVEQHGRALVRDAYGMADLELGVELKPEHVFRIGSITKQFTAVAILILAEEGKLSLDDDLTEFLPDYPTGEHRITVEHLLHHTSGVHSYTALPTWRTLMREDLQPDSLIAIFRDRPLDFTPGEDWAYSNSGYALLGRIIEVASGQEYAEFVRERLFEPARMTSSYYGDESRIIPNRVEGYVRTADGWRNDEYLSMAGPYSAGALLSTIDDLARWYDALEGGDLVGLAMMEKAYAAARLPDGRSTGYGYGWMLGHAAERPTIEHGGGINGFRAHALRIPTEDLVVVVLTNRVAEQPSPADVAVHLAELALGETGGPAVAELSAAELDEFIGVYRINEHERREITRQDGSLYSQRSGQEKFELLPLGDDEFLYPTGTRVRFERGEAGEVVRMIMRPRLGPETVAPRTDEEPGAPPTTVDLPQAILERYVGAYQFGPEAVLSIRFHGGALQAELTGLPPVMLEAQSETRFRAPRVPAWLEFEVGEDGRVDAVIVFMDGDETRAPRVPDQNESRLPD